MHIWRSFLNLLVSASICQNSKMADPICLHVSVEMTPTVCRSCLTGHVDTVPLGNEAWSCDPFGGKIRDGSGTTDTKGGVAAMVLAAIRLSQQLPDTPGVVLIVTGGEETGCDGAKALCEMPGVLGRARAIMVGEPTSNKPPIGHKGALWLRAVCRGVTAHGIEPLNWG
jgi:succinyl-diaminopimelate desuccinylase